MVDAARLRLLGLLLRHASYVGVTVGRGDLLDVLAERASDRNERVRRCSVAALGELL